MSPRDLEGRPLRVLLVEDSPDDALLLERHLRRNGFVTTMTRVETASEMRATLAATEPPQLVLADYNLPNFSGPEALQVLRASGRDLPFLMLSGAISEEAAVSSMRAGAHDYVTKQNLARLIPAIERELKEAEARSNTRAAELALRVSEDRFHHLVEAMPLPLLLSDTSGCIVYGNNALERLMGFSAADIAGGQVMLNTVCPSLAHRTLTPEDSQVEPFESVCVTAAGKSVDVLLGVALLNPAEAPERRQLAAFLVDLSMQKRSEELLRRTEKLAVAGRLAASIAHEINNPLEAITNCLYLLSHTTLQPEARAYLELAQNELNRVAQITVQTLRFYRRSTRPAPTQLSELLGTVVTLFEPRIRRSEIEVQTRYRLRDPVVVHDGEIRQVMANLISNALDALHGGGRLVLRTRPGVSWSSGQPGVRVTVADNGTGMDAETLGHLFEPFFSTKGITGTGLGLWVSHEIIEKHGGTVRVRSRRDGEVKGGTIFSIHLPFDSTLAAADPALPAS